MAGMSMGLATAANYPLPFVSGGTANAAVVYGTNAQTLDSVNAGNIQSDLSSSVSSSISSSSVSGGDFVKLERSPTNLFNLGEGMSDFYSSIDEDQLSTILAKGVYTNDVNDEFDYEQKITLGSDLDLEHFHDSDFNNDVPTIGFQQATGDTVLTYTLDFTPTGATYGTATSASDFPYLETTKLNILGYEYYVSSADYTGGTASLTLLDSADTSIVSEGETKTVNDKTVSISFIDSNEVKLVVNGETTNSLSEGSTYKLSDGSYVGIIDISSQDYAGGIKQVEFSIGTGKIVLTNGAEVQINGDEISDLYDQYSLTTIITNTTTALSSITLTWTLDDDVFIAPGDDITLPGFETLKLSMGGFVTGDGEKTELDPDGDDSIKLKTTVKDGGLNINLAYLNSGSTAIAGLGDSATHKLVTNATSGTTSGVPARIVLNETEKSYFVATWKNGDDAESFAYELQSITEGASHTNATKLDNLAGGSDIEFSGVGDDDTVGSAMTFNLTTSDDDTGIVTVDISATSGTVYTDRLVTADGMQVLLPIKNTANNNSAIAYVNIDRLNSTGDANTTQISAPTGFNLTVTEEDVNGQIANGPAFYLNFTVDSTEGLEVLSLTNVTTYETGDNTDVYEGYMVSPLSTKVVHQKPSSGLNDLTITYFGEETHADVYLSEASASISSDGEGGVMMVMDTEVSSVSSKNLIVVGGSCVNSAAAALVGGAYCGSSWTDATGVGTGQFLIKSYASSSITSKMALLVAGYEAADTTHAADYLTNQKPDTSSTLIGTSSTSAEVVVA